MNGNGALAISSEPLRSKKPWASVDGDVVAEYEWSDSDDDACTENGNTGGSDSQPEEDFGYRQYRYRFAKPSQPIEAKASKILEESPAKEEVSPWAHPSDWPSLSRPKPLEDSDVRRAAAAVALLYSLEPKKLRVQGNSILLPTGQSFALSRIWVRGYVFLYIFVFFLTFTFGEFLAKFERPVLGCINAKVCKT